MNRIQIILISIFAIFAIGTAGYVLIEKTHYLQINPLVQTSTFTLSPTVQSPTVGQAATAIWKTYKGKTYSIKYSNKYVTIGIPGYIPSSDAYPSGYTSIYFDFIKNSNNLSITEAKNTKGFTITNLFKSAPDPIDENNLEKGVTKEEITIDGVKGKVLKDLPAVQGGGAWATVVVWTNGSTVYEAWVQQTSLGDREGYKILLQMLSTFRFTNP